MSTARRLSPIWFLLAMTATFAVVTAISWLVHQGGEGPPQDDATPAGALPVLSVEQVLSADELPTATATVVGRLDALVPPGDDEPRALVLSREDGGGELLVVPDDDEPIPPAILAAGAGAGVRAVGQLRIATATNPPLGDDGRLTAEFLGEPLLEASLITPSTASAP